MYGVSRSPAHTGGQLTHCTMCSEHSRVPCGSWGLGERSGLLLENCPLQASSINVPRVSPLPLEENMGILPVPFLDHPVLQLIFLQTEPLENLPCHLVRPHLGDSCDDGMM